MLFLKVVFVVTRLANHEPAKKLNAPPCPRDSTVLLMNALSVIDTIILNFTGISLVVKNSPPLASAAEFAMNLE